MLQPGRANYLLTNACLPVRHHSGRLLRANHTAYYVFDSAGASLPKRSSQLGLFVYYMAGNDVLLQATQLQAPTELGALGLTKSFPNDTRRRQASVRTLVHCGGCLMWRFFFGR